MPLLKMVIVLGDKEFKCFACVHLVLKIVDYTAKAFNQIEFVVLIFPRFITYQLPMKCEMDISLPYSKG